MGKRLAAAGLGALLALGAGGAVACGDDSPEDEVDQIIDEADKELEELEKDIEKNS